MRLVYFSHLRPEDMEVRSADGRTLKPVQDLQETLQDLARHKSGGLFVPADDVWLVPPPEINPEFEQQVELLRHELPEMKRKPQWRIESIRADQPERTRVLIRWNYTTTWISCRASRVRKC